METRDKPGEINRYQMISDQKRIYVQHESNVVKSFDQMSSTTTCIEEATFHNINIDFVSSPQRIIISSFCCFFGGNRNLRKKRQISHNKMIQATIHLFTGDQEKLHGPEFRRCCGNTCNPLSRSEIMPVSFHAFNLLSSILVGTACLIGEVLLFDGEEVLTGNWPHAMLQCLITFLNHLSLTKGRLV